MNVAEQQSTITELKAAVAQQEAANAKQQRQIEALSKGLQKVELNKSVPMLGARCVIGKDHHAILSQNEMLSWIEQPPFRLSVAEAYYIGSLRPERNLSREQIDMRL